MWFSALGCGFAIHQERVMELDLLPSLIYSLTYCLSLVYHINLNKC